MHLLKRMHGTDAIARHQVVLHDGPEGVEGIGLGHTAAEGLGVGYAPAPAAFHVGADVGVQVDGRGNVAAFEREAVAPEGVVVLLAGIAMVDGRNLLVAEAVEALGMQVLHYEVEGLHDLLHRRLSGKDETAVGQTVVRRESVQAGGIAPLARRKHSHEVAPAVAQQERMVGEAVGMIVHVGALVEERAAARGADHGIPFGSGGRTIAFEGQHGILRKERYEARSRMYSSRS